MTSPTEPARSTENSTGEDGSAASGLVRADGRAVDELRPITITRGWSEQAEGSALIEFGGTRVLCTASLTEGVPRWLKGEGRGWVTAEYALSLIHI